MISEYLLNIGLKVGFTVLFHVITCISIKLLNILVCLNTFFQWL